MFAPWDAWPRVTSLILVPPAFALIALGNLYGGREHTYGVFFVVAFVWIGLAHGPWTSVAVAPLAIVANPKFPPNTIPELIAAAKARPGEINYGSGGSGSVTHLSFELLKSQTGIQMTHVPYKSIAPMMNDILGNQIPLGSPALASAVGNAKAGQVKILAVTSAKRSSLFPDIPTVAEAGFAGYDVSAWNGLLAPAGTPDAIVDKIYADVVRIAQTKEFADQMKPQALEVEILGPVQYKAFLASELDKWSKLVKSSGAKVD